ncbi:MAG: hypothetical protein KAI75_00230 [Desulfobulbaceae bacterium]|nr:hypothetical protein [Desulfobulbaceae bacterium]MCK5403612.1 hypothetical protein [Desulfobulbaceae bacterium]
MQTTMQAERVLFSHVDFTDDTFCLTPSLDQPIPESLTESIVRAGLLHPPILKEKSKNSYCIVTGWKRLTVLRETLVFSACNCLVLRSETSDLECLSKALEDALVSETCTPATRAVFFQKALRHLDEEQLSRRFLPAVGLSTHISHIHRSLDLLKLEEPLFHALHRGRLDEKAALEIIKLPFGDRMALFEVVEALHLSIGNQRKIVVACKELAARHNSSIISILSSSEVSEILDHPEANIPQKTANLMALLHRQRFPRATQAEKEFRQFRGGLNLPNSVTLEHAQAFEKDSVTLTIPFQNQEQLQKVWPDIKKLLR